MKKTKSQLEKFQQAARELECDESDGALERVFKEIDPKKKEEKHTKSSKNK